MPALKESKTEQNLKDAFAGESQANRRYLYFAQKADIEGYNDISAVFRSTAEGETGHAHGHLQFLEEVGDPATGEPIGATDANLKAAIVGETHEYTDMYPGMARTAREEGFEEIADWSRPWPRPRRATPGASRRPCRPWIADHFRPGPRNPCHDSSEGHSGHRSRAPGRSSGRRVAAAEGRVYA